MNFNHFLACISDRYRAMFGQKGARYDRIFSIIAAPVLSKLAAGDAPYHTVDHTLQVISVGQALLEGKQHYDGSVSPRDWLNTLVSLLCHDIGYVKGLCEGDRPSYQQYSDGKGGHIYLPAMATGAALGEHHIDRSQAYVATRLSQNLYVDHVAVQWNIEMTRFPVPQDLRYEDTLSYGGLCRAADLLGQLSDPQYLRKLPALFEEFEETGINRTLGYRTPEDLRANYPDFYRHVMYPYIRLHIRYLNVTPAGRKHLAHLYTNVRLAKSAQCHSDVTTPDLTQLDSEANLVPWQEAGFIFSRAIIDRKVT